MDDKLIYNRIKEIVLDVLNENKLLVNQWHHGKVSEVISDKHLKVFVDGSNISQTISCNPDVLFNVDDEVWVVYINGNPRDKHVLSKRSV